MMIPEIVELKYIFKYLEKLSYEEENEAESQLALSIILNSLMKNKEKIEILNIENINILMEIGCKNKVNIKILEMILNLLKEKDNFCEKFDELRETAPQIDWELVDDNPNSEDIMQDISTKRLHKR